MTELIIKLLIKINDDAIDITNNQSHPLINAVIYLANEYLTNDNDSIQKIIDAGFNVFPGEQDRFGWLIGCIQLKKGIIVFG